MNYMPLVLISYLAILLGMAFWTARRADNQSFFIGNKSSNWILVAFGMIGTSLSGMTFISVPGTVGSGGFNYGWVVLGYGLGYLVIAYILLPLYYKLELTSIYKYLNHRFGDLAHQTGAWIFIVSRTLGATLRLYLVIHILERYVLQSWGLNFHITAVFILLLIVLYTFKGGVKTIVWTDTLQTTFMLLALVICTYFILDRLQLNISQAWIKMQEQQLTNWHGDRIMNSGYWLKQLLGGFFITIAMTGLDQEMMQKNISVKTLKDARKNILCFSVIIVLVNFVFLFLGGLLQLYNTKLQLHLIGDAIFPGIAYSPTLPWLMALFFLIGLVSALFPSADGALTAVTASVCVDVLHIDQRMHLNALQKTKLRKGIHGVMALLFLICVFIFKAVDQGSLIQLLLKIAALTYGPLLGLFAFGIFTKFQISKPGILITCIAAPVLSYGLQFLLNKHLHYEIGPELLLINGSIAFLGFWIFKKNAEVLI